MLQFSKIKYRIRSFSFKAVTNVSLFIGRVEEMLHYMSTDVIWINDK